MHPASFLAADDLEWERAIDGISPTSRQGLTGRWKGEGVTSASRGFLAPGKETNQPSSSPLNEESGTALVRGIISESETTVETAEDVLEATDPNNVGIGIREDEVVGALKVDGEGKGGEETGEHGGLGILQIGGGDGAASVNLEAAPVPGLPVDHPVGISVPYSPGLWAGGASPAHEPNVSRDAWQGGPARSAGTTGLTGPAGRNWKTRKRCRR